MKWTDGNNGLKGLTWTKGGREVKVKTVTGPGIRYGVEVGNVLVRIGDTYISPGITKDEFNPLRKAVQKPAVLLFMRKQTKARSLNVDGAAAIQKAGPKYVSCIAMNKSSQTPVN